MKLSTTSQLILTLAMALFLVMITWSEGYSSGWDTAVFFYDAEIDDLSEKVTAVEILLLVHGLERDCAVTWEYPTADQRGRMGMFVCEGEEE